MISRVVEIKEKWAKTPFTKNHGVTYFAPNCHQSRCTCRNMKGHLEIIQVSKGTQIPSYGPP